MSIIIIISIIVAALVYMDAEKHACSKLESLGCFIAVFLHVMLFMQILAAMPFGIVPAGVGAWVYVDAKKNGYRIPVAIGWFIGVSWLLLVFLPVYFIIKARRARQPEILTSCEFCKKHYSGNPNYCPHCGHLVRKLDY